MPDAEMSTGVAEGRQVNMQIVGEIAVGNIGRQHADLYLHVECIW